MRVMILLALMVSTRNGDVYLREGAVAEARQDYESARQLYEYAVAEDTGDAGYAAALKGVEGKVPRGEKRVAPKVILLEPAEQIIHGLELNHKSARALYEEVGRVAGMHVRFDAGVGVDSAVEGFGSLSEALLETALDAVARATQTSWQAVSSDMILVSQRTESEPSRVVVEPVRHYTDLEAAVRAGAFADAVRAVVNGADLRVVNASNGRGVMHDVCAAGQADLIPLLAEFGADAMLRDRFGQTPLQVALEYKNEKAVGALLALKGVHEQMMDAAAHAMEDAAVRGYTEIARILLENGMDASAYLGDAALKGQAGVVVLLLDHGAKMEAQNRFGDTALQDAAVGGNVEVLRLLLKRGAKVDGRNGVTGATALMMAVEMGKVEAVRVLLQAGADRELKDGAGRGALDRAVGNEEMVKLLSAQLPLAR